MASQYSLYAVFRRKRINKRQHNRMVWKGYSESNHQSSHAYRWRTLERYLVWLLEKSSRWKV